MGRSRDFPALTKLLTLGRSGSFSLDNTLLYQEALGHPHRCYKTIHIAGTNGKGSVAHKIAHSLQLAGCKTGLYTSPHVHDVTERIQINGQPISPEALNLQLETIFSIKGGYFFETLTAAAFNYFAQENVDWAVIETGLGGRLDPTNIVTPELSIITSIGLDHTEYLGPTLQHIAREKAGIIKPGVPVIVGPSVPISGIRVAGPFPTYLHENSAIAKTACDHLNIPFVNVSPPCRFQQVGHVILDAAHNPPALTRLFEAVLYTQRQKPHVIAGFSRPVPASFDILRAYAETVQIVDLADPNFDIPDTLTVITGSFYLMAAAFDHEKIRGF